MSYVGSESVYVLKDGVPTPFYLETRSRIISGTCVGVALAALAAAYLTVGFTPLAKTLWLFSPLTHLNQPALIGILVGCGVIGVSLAAGGCGAYLKGPGPTEEFICSKSDPEVNRSLKYGFKNYLDYYAFYSNLKKIEDKHFLSMINGKKFFLREHNVWVTIDTSWHGRKNLDLEVKKLKSSDYPQVREIWEGAFRADLSNVQGYIANQTAFVVKEKGSEEVLGCVACSYTSSDTIFFHTLARKAPAVGLKISELLIGKIRSLNSEHIECVVLKENWPARAIYEGLDFYEKTDQPKGANYLRLRWDRPASPATNTQAPQS